MAKLYRQLHRQLHWKLYRQLHRGEAAPQRSFQQQNRISNEVY